MTIGLESMTLFAGWTIGSLAVALATWVLGFMVFAGWTPLVVTSGSMEPSIRVGDVVLVDPGYQQPGEGSVLAYETGEGVTIHRVVSANPDGSLVTKGDSNVGPDSTSVRPDEVLGVGRLLVPYIGMLRTTGWIWPTAIAGLIAVTVFLTARPRSSALSAVLVLVLVITTSTGAAAFANTTASTGSSADVLDLAPPTSVNASCGLIGSEAVNVNLTWAAPSTVGFAGYRIYRDGPSAGSNFAAVGTTGSSATSFTDAIPTPLDVLGTYTYVVRTHSGSWESEDSNSDGVLVTQLILVYVCTDA